MAEAIAPLHLDQHTIPQLDRAKTPAADKVLTLPELVSQIILALDPIDIQKTRRVSKIWNALYLSSTQIRNVAVLMACEATFEQSGSEPSSIHIIFPHYRDHSTSMRINSIFEEAPRLGNGLVSCKLHLIAGPMLNWLSDKDYHRLMDSFFTSPPVRVIGLRTQSYDVCDNYLGDYSEQYADIYVPSGIRTRDVFDIMWQLKAQAQVKEIVSPNNGNTDRWEAEANLWLEA